MVAGAGGLYPQLGWSNHSDETHLQYVCPFWVNRCREIQPQCSLLSVVSPIGDKLGRGQFVR